jgi:hypothetical protein
VAVAHPYYLHYYFHFDPQYISVIISFLLIIITLLSVTTQLIITDIFNVGADSLPFIFIISIPAI